MLFKIFDVGHGLCAYAVARNGNVVVVDCGHKPDPERRPSHLLRQEGCGGIAHFFVTNYDEDHVSDLPALRAALPIQWLHRNPSISPADLRRLKLRSGPITPAMESLLEMLSTYTDTASPEPPVPGIDYTFFWNAFGEFNDTNNLSLALFLDIGDLHVMLPGDLERQGWLQLLRRAGFCDQLSKVNLFVASHHGRESGYCGEVFEYCRPDVVVFSDDAIDYETQQMADRYKQHARGIYWAGKHRYVLSTRNDGDLFWRL